MKILDINEAPRAQKIWDISHILSTQFHGHGNDSYYELTIVLNPDADEDGGGYVTVSQLQKLMGWCRLQGVQNGETVLIKHWW